MKTLIAPFIIITLSSFLACTERDELDVHFEMMKEAEEAEQTEFDTPEGLSFKMTIDEYNKSKYKKCNKWKYDKIYKGSNIEANFSDGVLYEYNLSLRVNESDIDKICDFYESYLKRRYSFKKFEYLDLGYDTYLFIKNNMAITLKFDRLEKNKLNIYYENRPVSSSIQRKNYEEREKLEESSPTSIPIPDIVEVKNNKWNGGVKQVEDYLEYQYLRDPDSYESIEWSEVKEKSDGYYVRHKYKAKNGYGGIIVKNQLFRLDFSGNVIEVKDLY